MCANFSLARTTGFVSTALLLCLPCTTTALGAAEVEVMLETDTSLSVKFTDAGGAEETIDFTRNSPDDRWEGPSQPGGPMPGIAFGNTDPSFASSATLRALEISPQEAIRTFNSDIADRPLDDVTIYQLYESGEMAIALWREGSITEIWYIGALVDEVLELPDAQVCMRLINLCCATWQPGIPGCPVNFPNTRVSSCIAAQNCPGNFPQNACACLANACLFCDEHPDCCDAVQDMHDVSADSCDAYGNHCIQQPDPEGPFIDTLNLLGEAADRLQAIIDAS